jgi:acyl-CoA dehydrogenase
MVDFSLTKEQIDLQNRTREFAQEYMIPYAHYYDKTGEFPLPIIKKCWEAGLMNLAIPLNSVLQLRNWLQDALE